MKIYTSCNELPLGIFLDILYNGSIQKLKKSRFSRVSKKKLKNAWATIYDEYSDLSKSESTQAFFQLLKQKTTLQNKLFITQLCIDSLKVNYSRELVNVLRKLGHNFKFTRESLTSDLKKVVAKSKPLVIRLKKLEENIAPYLSAEDLSRSDFEDILVSLSKFQGYRLNKSEITVTEFVNILNNYKAWLTHKK